MKYVMIALKGFFRNGEYIQKREIIECDEEARKQMLEEGLMEDYAKESRSVKK